MANPRVARRLRKKRFGVARSRRPEMADVQGRRARVPRFDRRAADGVLQFPPVPSPGMVPEHRLGSRRQPVRPPPHTSPHTDTPHPGRRCGKKKKKERNSISVFTIDSERKTLIASSEFPPSLFFFFSVSFVKRIN